MRNFLTGDLLVSRRHEKCGGKIRYRDKDEAIASAHLRTTGARGGDRPHAEYLRVYECGRCKGWHLTSQIAHAERVSAGVAQW